MKQGYLNVTQTAEYIGISRPTLYRMFEKGLPSYSKGERHVRLVKISELNEWLEEQAGRPAIMRKY